MIKCPNCNQKATKVLERCQYCNAELPKTDFGKFLKIKVTEVISEDGSFKMITEGIFSIAGRGDVITGKVQKGIIRVNDNIVLISKEGERIQCKVKAIEKFRKLLQEATAGDSVGLLVSDR